MLAVAKPLELAKPAHSSVSGADAPQHKRGRSLLFLAHHGGAAVNLTRAPTPSRHSKHKHHHHKHSEHRHHSDKAKVKVSASSTPVYDQCLHEAMKLKTRILIEHRERATRFRLSAMKRVVIPPVNIPETQRKGTTNIVSGKPVAFTKAMWKAQKQTYRQSHGLPVIHEYFRV